MSKQPNILRIAVASDLHAHSLDKNSPSHLDIRIPTTITNQHPIAALCDLISRQGLTSDAMLSPGDLGHQASILGVQYAWTALHDIGRALGATLTTATAGNHDIDSRYQGDDHSPEHVLKGLKPPFPLGTDTLNDRYWARAYVIVDHEKFRLLMLNSAAFHGHTKIEQNHGRIDRQTLEDIRRDLTTRGVRPVNVFLCHHHPQPHSELGLGEADVMKQGQLLLDLLGSGEFGRWLIIHGHKHHPKITYAAGGAGSPVVFSAGSLCSKLFLPLQTVARNQFYIIEIHTNLIEQLGFVGRVHCWDWASGVGWIPAGVGSGLPSEFGFGHRGDPLLIATQIAELLKSGTGKREWASLISDLPSISYMLPQDFKRAETELLSKHNIEIVSSEGIPKQVGVKL